MAMALLAVVIVAVVARVFSVSTQDMNQVKFTGAVCTP